MNERRILLVSVLFALFFALFGIVYGIIIDSSMVMFDGIYSTISVILSLLSVAVLTQVKEGSENDRFPFGKWHFEPALIVFKSFVIVGLCIYSLTGAIGDIVAGGNDVKIGLALIYSLLSFILCALIYLFIRIRNRSIDSDLLSAESTQWFGDAVLSFGVLVGFGLTYFAEGTRFDKYTSYADPIMVLIASMLFIFFPMKSLFIGFRQLLFYRADDSIGEAITKEVKRLAALHDAQYKMHLVRVGRGLFLEVNFLMDDKRISVKEMDEMRESIESITDKEVWLNMNITSQRKWI